MVSGEKFVIVSTERLLDVYFNMGLQLVLSFKTLFCSVFILLPISFNFFFFNVLCQTIERSFLYNLLIFFFFFIFGLFELQIVWPFWGRGRRKRRKRRVFILFDHRPALAFETVLLCINKGGLQDLQPTEMGEDRGVICSETKIAVE